MDISAHLNLTDAHLKRAKPWQSTEHIVPLSYRPAGQCSCTYSNHLYDMRNSPAFTSSSVDRDTIRFHDSLSDRTNSICIHKSTWNFTFAKCQLPPIFAESDQTLALFPITVVKVQRREGISLILQQPPFSVGSVFYYICIILLSWIKFHRNGPHLHNHS